ncbi:MAG TPA: hypothetical protein VNN10_04885 [Dehalococcoidia bacterium]|nr:hypothetical protein [Dehalococcoidia bacterium]
MPGAVLLEERRHRVHLYEITYWCLAMYSAFAALSPADPRSLAPLLFAAAGFCAGLCILLGSTASGAAQGAPAKRERSGALPASDQALKVELERARRKDGGLAAVLLQMDRGPVELSNKDYHAALQSAVELLRRYLGERATVLRLQGERIAVILPGAVVYDVERLLDRLKEDLRGWSRATGGVGFTAGVVVDRGAQAPVDDLIRNLTLAVRRAAVYRRDRFVFSES